MKWLIYSIVLWLALAWDFVIPMTEMQHIAIHIIVGSLGTVYLYKIRKKL